MISEITKEGVMECPIFTTYPEVYKNIDWLLGVRSEGDAREIIDDIMKDASAKEIRQLKAAFLGSSKRGRDGERDVDVERDRDVVRARRGGKGGNDYLIYDLLQLVDTCHDFVNTPLDLRDMLRTTKTILPVGFFKKLLRDGKALTNWFAENETIRFPSKTVDNPLYKVNILERFDIDGDGASSIGSMTDLMQKYNNRVRSDAFDIYTETNHAKPEIMKLIMVAELCKAIRDRFGVDCSFQVDSTDDQLVILICAAAYISRAFYNRFMVDGAVVVNTNWVTAVTDANIFDAAVPNKDLPIDRRPTGNIFRKENGYQIELLGVGGRGGGRVNVRITDGNVAAAAAAAIPLMLSLTVQDTTDNLSKAALKALIGLQAVAVAGNKKPTVRDLILTLSTECQYALKRAGDWGQVENCLVYDKVFVTADKFAALYAIFRGVKCIFMRRREYPGKIGGNDLIAYTFVLN